MKRILSAVFTLLCIGLLFVSCGKNSEFKNALDKNDAAEIYTQYMTAKYNGEEIDKYDELLVEKINEIEEELNQAEFPDSGELKGFDAVKAFLNNYGTLFNDSDSKFKSLIQETGVMVQDAYNHFFKLRDSKEAYLEGLYQMNTQKNYLDACESFKLVEDFDSFNELSQEKMMSAAEQYIDEVIKQADEYYNNGDVSSAVELLNGAKDELNLNVPEVEAKVQEYIAKKAQAYADKAAQFFAGKDVNAAIGNMEVACQLMPDNAEYKTKLNEYKLYVPLDLCDEENALSRTNGYVKFVDSEIAVNGTEYKNCLEFTYTQDKEEGNIVYLLEGKYDTVKGLFMSVKENASMHRTGTCYFEAYGDGKLLFTSSKISAESMPNEFTFSVTGIQKLEIKFIGRGSSVWGADAMWNGDYGAISNFTAYKEIK